MASTLNLSLLLEGSGTATARAPAVRALPRAAPRATPTIARRNAPVATIDAKPPPLPKAPVAATNIARPRTAPGPPAAPSAAAGPAATSRTEVSTPQAWLHEHTHLQQLVRGLERDILSIAKAESGSVAAAAKRLSGPAAASSSSSSYATASMLSHDSAATMLEVPSALAAAAASLTSERTSMLREVHRLHASVQAVSRAIGEAVEAAAAAETAAAGGAGAAAKARDTSATAAPAIPASRVRQLQGHVDRVSASLVDYRDKQKRAYAALAVEEAKLAAEVEAAATVWGTGENGGLDGADAAPAPVEPRATAADEDGSGNSSSCAAQRPNTTAAVSASAPAAPPTVPSRPTTASAAAAAAAAPAATDKVSRLRAECDALKAAVAETDAQITAAGGATGKWPADEAEQFTSVLASFLSARGRQQALRFVPTLSAVPPAFLSPGEASLLADRVCAVMPGRSREDVEAHIRWYLWWRHAQERKLGLVGEWKALNTRLQAYQRKAATGAAEGHDTGTGGAASGGRRCSKDSGSITDSIGRNTSMDSSVLEKRAALVEWRAKKDVEARAAAEAAAAEAAAEAAAKEERQRAYREAQELKLLAWKAQRERESQLAAIAAQQEVSEAGGGAGSATTAATAVALKMRAQVALEAAAVKRDAMRKAAAELEAERARKWGVPPPAASSGGGDVSAAAAAAAAAAAVAPAGRIPLYLAEHLHAKATAEAASSKEADVEDALRWLHLPHNPERPTTAAIRRSETREEREARQAAARASRLSAHDGPVASVGHSRGKSFTFGTGGVLRAKAVPTWRKAAM